MDTFLRVTFNPQREVFEEAVELITDWFKRGKGIQVGLTHLLKENKSLKMEREILKKAAAFFSKKMS